jgi:hypothetical protein
MQVHFINSGYGTDDGFKEVDVISLKLDHDDAPYAIVSHPYQPFETCRAERNYHNGSLQWVVDFD